MPSTLVPSSSWPCASIGAPWLTTLSPSRVRQAPTASKFSIERPMGSMILWHAAQPGFFRCSSMRSRIVRMRPPRLASSLSGGTLFGIGGTGALSRLSSTHLPRTTGDVRSVCDVTISTAPLPSRP